MSTKQALHQRKRPVNDAFLGINVDAHIKLGKVCVDFLNLVCFVFVCTACLNRKVTTNWWHAEYF